MGNVSWVMTMITTGFYLSTGVIGATGPADRSGPKPGELWYNSLKPQGQPGPEITLSLAGETDYVVTIPEEATTQEEKAAEGLTHWLQEMTGAIFPIYCAKLFYRRR